ncbi:hypothetical protein TSOC_010781 [Tetrabaena socialis]|uniref:FAS1 domain-containing protein n=1 Tax=Tetrabaena socialis TaxID=47790 RepID=A0A2J7ZSF5_9CHLO|nr:hypothetical protein TSOC_010781 [Tetrabaena socialis]|eukprot:PNH03201.1 hypothetical protein TSOC_010781 [Tetrabaena socialis]
MLAQRLSTMLGATLALVVLGSLLAASPAAAAASPLSRAAATRRSLLQAEVPQATEVPQTTPQTTPQATRRRPRPAVPVPLLPLVPPTVPSPNATDLAVDSWNATGTNATVANTTATIFAPTDAAFAALATSLGFASPLDLFNSTYNATAANITALHVIPGQALTAANITALGNVTLPSLLPGYNLTITALPNGTVTVTVPGSDVFGTVVTPDVPFDGSIVHVIDTVLLPPTNDTAGWALPLP